MKQFIGALLLIGCLVACDPSPCTEAIEAPQETTKSNAAVAYKPLAYSVFVFTADSTDQFVFSVYPEKKIRIDKHSIIVFPPKEERSSWRDKFSPVFETIHTSKDALENELEIHISFADRFKYHCRHVCFQNREELKDYTNETNDLVIGVYSKKYTEKDIDFISYAH